MYQGMYKEIMKSEHILAAKVPENVLYITCCGNQNNEDMI